MSWAQDRLYDLIAAGDLNKVVELLPPVTITQK